MPQLMTSTIASFTAGTRAKASEVNGKFTHFFETLRNALYIPKIGGFLQPRADAAAASFTLTGSDSFVAAYYTIAPGTTLDLATSTSRAVFFGELALSTNAVFHVASDSVALIL